MGKLGFQIPQLLLHSLFQGCRVDCVFQSSCCLPQESVLQIHFAPFVRVGLKTFFQLLTHLLQTFKVVETVEVLSASAVSGTVTSALLTSAAGLAGAIPCYVAYNYLVARIDTITLEMDRAALDIVSFFERKQNKGAQQ